MILWKPWYYVELPKLETTTRSSVSSPAEGSRGIKSSIVSVILFVHFSAFTLVAWAGFKSTNLRATQGVLAQYWGPAPAQRGIRRVKCSVQKAKRGENSYIAHDGITSDLFHKLSLVFYTSKTKEITVLSLDVPKGLFEIPHAWRWWAARSKYPTACINVALIKTQWPLKTPGDSGLPNSSAQKMGEQTPPAFDSCKQKQQLPWDSRAGCKI